MYSPYHNSCRSAMVFPIHRRDCEIKVTAIVLRVRASLFGRTPCCHTSRSQTREFTTLLLLPLTMTGNLSTQDVFVTSHNSIQEVRQSYQLRGHLTVAVLSEARHDLTRPVQLVRRSSLIRRLTSRSVRDAPGRSEASRSEATRTAQGHTHHRAEELRSPAETTTFFCRGR